MIEQFTNGKISERWDPVTRVHTSYNAAGQVTASVPFTAAENARADADALAATSATNQVSIETALSNDLATLQAIIDDTNANINQNPAQRIKDLARVQRRVIRLVIRRFDGTT